METIRQFLKQETVGEHLRVDRAVSKLDLAQRDDLRQFLCIHNMSLRLIDAGWEMSDLIDVQALIDLTEQDLAVLGAAPPKVVVQNARYSERLGPAYVLAGSHFGMRVLQRHWKGASDPLVRQANTFLGTDILAQSWHHVMSLLVESPMAARARIAAAARRTFNIYHAAIEDCIAGDEQVLAIPVAEQAYGAR